jgi:hypothetical protein
MWIPQKARRDTLRRTCVFRLVGIASHVVHFSAFMAQNFNARFLMLGWDKYEFHKKRWDTLHQTCGFLHPVRFVGHVMHSSAFGLRNVDALFFHFWVGLIRIPQKAHWDTLHQTSVFVSYGICRSRSAFRCIRGAKPRLTIFHAQVVVRFA